MTVVRGPELDARRRKNNHVLVRVTEDAAIGELRSALVIVDVTAGVSSRTPDQPRSGLP